LWTNGLPAQPHEVNDLACMLREALCDDRDEPSDRQRRWSGLLARIDRPQRLDLGRARADDQMPSAWLLGWRMISLARAVS